MNRNMSYGDFIKNTTKQNFPHLKINKDGRMLLDSMMNGIHSSLMEKYDQEYKKFRKKTPQANLECVRKAVSKALPEEYRQMALEEGERKLTMYQTGDMKYDYAKSIEELKKSQKSAKKSSPANVPPILSKFTAAVGKINACFSSRDLKIEAKAKKLLGFHLFKLTANIAARAAETVPEDSSLKYTHIVDILPEFLGSSILELAHSEGSQSLRLHSQGVQVFKPNKIKPLSLPDDLEDSIFKHPNDVEDHDALIKLAPRIFWTGIGKLLANRKQTSVKDALITTEPQEEGDSNETEASEESEASEGSEYEDSEAPISEEEMEVDTSEEPEREGEATKGETSESEND